MNIMLYNWNKLSISAESVMNQIYMTLYFEDFEVHHNTRDLGSKASYNLYSDSIRRVSLV